MLIVNFTHPVTGEQREQIEVLAGIPIGEVRNIPIDIKQEEPLPLQITTIVDIIRLSSEEWQTRPLLIRLDMPQQP